MGKNTISSKKNVRKEASLKLSILFQHWMNSDLVEPAQSIAMAKMYIKLQKFINKFLKK